MKKGFRTECLETAPDRVKEIVENARFFQELDIHIHAGIDSDATTIEYRIVEALIPREYTEEVKNGKEY